MPWPPHLYKKQGVLLGRKPEVLEKALAQARIPEERVGAPPILTLGHLAQHVDVPYRVLREIIERRSNPYRVFRVHKRSGGYRVICIPQPPLMRTMRWLDRHVLRCVQPSSYSFAYHQGRSMAACAQMHAGCRWLIKIDLRRFFESISERDVYKVYRRIGYQPLVAMELARLCTRVYGPASKRYKLSRWISSPAYDLYGDVRIGHLPQGAPTSPRLSNFAMIRRDHDIARVAQEFGLVYTRYSDDLHFSTSGNFSRSRAEQFVRAVYTLLASRGLNPNAAKTVIAPPGARRIVLGLTVDGGQPRLTKEFRRNLLRHLYFLKLNGPLKHSQSRGFASVIGLRHHLEGMAAYACNIAPEFGQRILEQLKEISWPL
jgi:RNA-directed DNA polymerase